jgi:hypothetical protein
MKTLSVSEWRKRFKVGREVVDVDAHHILGYQGHCSL